MHTSNKFRIFAAQFVLVAGLIAMLVPSVTAEPGGCLIISEVVMGAESGGHPRWIEITNTGTMDYTFLAGGIIVQLDGETDTTVDVDLTDVTIPASGSFVIDSTAGGAGGAYYGIYMADPDLYTPAVFGDGDDRYILTDAADGSNMLDIYGQYGTDGTGTAWEYTQGYAYRLPSANGGNGGFFDPSEWYFGGVDSLAGGDPTALLLAYTDPQRHSWNDTCSPADMNPCLIISEVVMGAESGGHPRWIEITNTGLQSYTFNGGGIIIQMDNDVDLNVDVDLTDVTIPASASFVIDSTAGGAGGAYYGVYMADPDLYSSAPFGDGNDRYILTDGTQILDIYGQFGVNGTGTAWEYTQGYAYRLPEYNSGNLGSFHAEEWYFGGVNSLAGGDPTALLLAYTDPQRHSWNDTCGRCPGDLTGDLMVNLSDLAALLSNYGDTGTTYDDGDLDEDGDVDLSDLAALLSLYGTDCL